MGDTSSPCPVCVGTGHVCENHPNRLWGGMCCDPRTTGGGLCVHGACHCGAGMPCPTCTRPPAAGDPVGDAFQSWPVSPEQVEAARQPTTHGFLPPVLTGGLTTDVGGGRA